MANVAYYRVSTAEQSTESQRAAIESIYNIDKEFIDHGVSGVVKAKLRPGFLECMNYLREEDNLIVFDLDRLGRDSIDVQTTIAELKAKGVRILIHQLGLDLSSDIGDLVVTIMSKIAEMERKKILARTKAGRIAAKEAGKHLGRPQKVSLESVAECRSKGMSIQETSNFLGISTSSVKRATVEAKEKGILNR